MNKEDLSKLTWKFQYTIHLGQELISVLIESTYGSEERVHSLVKPNGEKVIWVDYIYNNQSYPSWDEFAAAVKNVKVVPGLRNKK